MLCFMVASRCHPVAIVRDFAAVLCCWDSFWRRRVVILVRFDIILSFILASTSHHVTLCILLMPCCAVDVILELLSGYFAVVLASCCALCSRPDAIPWPICTTMLRCWDSFWRHRVVILVFWHHTELYRMG